MVNTSGEKMSNLLSKLNEFRIEEMRKFVELQWPYGNVTTINLTKLNSGIHSGIAVIPPKISAIFDIRVSVNSDLNEFEQQVKQYAKHIL